MSRGVSRRVERVSTYSLHFESAPDELGDLVDNRCSASDGLAVNGHDGRLALQKN